MENHTVVQFESHRKRGYCKLGKAELICVLEATRLVEKKETYMMIRFRTIPPQFYNQYLGGHQISRRKLSKR